MSENTIRFASLGTSSIQDVMQEAMKQTDGVECRVVCSRSSEKAAAYAARVGVSESSGDFSEVLKRKDIDAVYLATPNVCHTEHVLQVLQAGKHAVVEKPAALCPGDIRKMMDAASANGVYFFEAITTIFTPNFVSFREMLPKIGRILNAEIRYGQYSTKLEAYLQGHVPSNLDPRLKGGALNDMGIYNIHAAVRLFGEPDHIVYEPVYGPNDADIEGTLTLTYDTYPSHLGTQPISGTGTSDPASGSDEKLIVRIYAAKNRNSGSGLHIEGSHGYLEENGPLNDFMTCRASVGAKEYPVDLQPKGNRMLYELAAFRDAINSHDDAFYQEMCGQSMAAARVLEEAHRCMRW